MGIIMKKIRPIKIRSVRIDEIPAVINLLKQCKLHDPDDTKEAYLRKIKRDKNLMLAALERGKIVGFVMANYDGWLSIIWRLAVAHSNRRRGIASLLLQELLKRLRRRGLKRVYSLVVPKNKAGAHCFNNHGFRLQEKINLWRFSFA